MDVFKNNQVLKSVVSRFSIVVDDEKICSPDEIWLRANFHSADDVLHFIRTYSEATKTSWKVVYSLKDPKKFYFRKKWRCHFSSGKVSGGCFEKLGCEAFIDVTILKRDCPYYLKKDKFLSTNPPLPGIIRICFNHDHSEFFKKESCQNKVKQKFYGYFSIGVQQQEAKHLHEAFLRARGHRENNLADVNINPSNFMVNYLYMSWKKINPKSTSTSFIKIQENQKHYENKDASVFVDDNVPFAVVVVTAAFKRAQNLMASSDSVFVDTTLLSGCAFTCMFIETSVGAVPIAILIHQDQTTKSYVTAFKLLKSSLQSCFGDGMASKIFITDVKDAVKLALSEVWPSSKQIMGNFNVTVAEWDYIWRQVKATQDKLKLMKLFYTVMHGASTKTKIDDSVQEILSLESEHPTYVEHFKKLMERRNEWIQYDKLPQKNIDMNTYSELTIRIFKNVILTQCETFTLPTLIEFCISVIGEHLVTHFSNFLYKEPGLESILYRALYKKRVKLPCKKLSQGSFLVQKESSNLYYLVNGDFGVCSCDFSKTGAFCIHQIFLFEEGIFKFPNFPAITQADEFDLSFLALGDRYPLSNVLSNKKYESNISSSETVIIKQELDEMGTLLTPGFSIDKEVFSQCRAEINRVLSLVKSKTYEPSLIKLTHMLQNIQTESDAVSALERL